jgi:hypothetical protein
VLRRFAADEPLPSPDRGVTEEAVAAR